jgi:hypothetical protein
MTSWTLLRPDPASLFERKPPVRWDDGSADGVERDMQSLHLCLCEEEFDAPRFPRQGGVSKSILISVDCGRGSRVDVYSPEEVQVLRILQEPSSDENERGREDDEDERHESEDVAQKEQQ